ncbi:MAG: hypothetical protein H7832_03415 [Magnetococcus sp. DMHC-6]
MGKFTLKQQRLEEARKRLADAGIQTGPRISPQKRRQMEEKKDFLSHADGEVNFGAFDSVDMVTLSIRISKEIVDRLDALGEKFRHDPAFQTGNTKRVTKTFIIREALTLGVAHLENREPAQQIDSEELSENSDVSDVSLVNEPVKE